jgi:hypothetical protein
MFLSIVVVSKKKAHLRGGEDGLPLFELPDCVSQLGARDPSRPLAGATNVQSRIRERVVRA